MTNSPELRAEVQKPAAPAAPSVGITRRILAHRRAQEMWTFAAFCLLFLGFAIWLQGKFLQVPARLLDVHTNTPILLLALAAMVTLVCGQFDLSIAGMATLSTFLTIGLVINSGWPMGAAIAFAAAVGIAGGLLNAFLVVGLRINAFIATLATSGLYLGASEIYSGGTAITPSVSGPQIPHWFQSFGTFTTRCPSWLVWIGVAAALFAGWRRIRLTRPARIDQRAWDAISLGIIGVVVAVLFLVFNIREWVDDVSWLIATLLAVAFVMWVLIERTAFGRNLRATGANAAAARLAGVPTKRVTVIAFAIGGLLAAMSGVTLAAAVGSAQPGVATDLLLPAFAAAFLSTVLFSTGQFNVWGTIVGGIFVVWVSEALILGGLNFTWNDVVNGIVLAAAVAFSSVLTRGRTR